MKDFPPKKKKIRLRVKNEPIQCGPKGNRRHARFDMSLIRPGYKIKAVFYDFIIHLVLIQLVYVQIIRSP